MRTAVLPLLSVLLAVACAGRAPPPPRSEADEAATDAEMAQAQKPCGAADTVQRADLSTGAATDVFTPCARNGPRDYSAIVRLEPVDDGVHIVIDATDDDVKILGPEVEARDAVIVYPRGKGQASVEVPLVRTRTGYHGDKIVFWDQLGKLSDDGGQIDVAIYDHDAKTGETEQLHVAVGVSTGKSCHKAQDENPQQVVVGRAGARDLGRDELGQPITRSNAAVACGLPGAAHAKICVVVRQGKPLGVTVDVTPENNRVAACIDRRVRGLAFPVGENADTVSYSY